jgi:carbon monoxide dehydrogenase subunit G
MALERSFITQLPSPDAWAWISDLEQLAGAMPGFSPATRDDTGLTGKFVLRVGSQQVTYTGRIAVAASDSGRLGLTATGAGARGSGEASADVQLRLDDGPDGTIVTVVVRATGSGRIESFDREGLAASGERLLDRFVAAIQEHLPVAESAPAAEPAPVAEVEPMTSSEPIVEPEPIAEVVPVAEPEPAPERERLATVTSISDVVRSRSRARRSAAASAVAMVAAMIALWLVHRRNAH